MRKQIFIIEACHMPGTVVGCQLLCLGSCLARGIVLQLFVQTYHRLQGGIQHVMGMSTGEEGLGLGVGGGGSMEVACGYFSCTPLLVGAQKRARMFVGRKAKKGL